RSLSLRAHTVALYPLCGGTPQRPVLPYPLAAVFVPKQVFSLLPKAAVYQYIRSNLRIFRTIFQFLKRGLYGNVSISNRSKSAFKTHHPFDVFE
ncbi:hypothetical protein, partial [Treponema socranskii]|uniref:hypothetical protein n=1 Tax=Treponema socranskii TaxID=53419 RepID=UPI0023EFA640